MNCNECQPLLADLALDLLAREQLAAVRAHLGSGCLACRDELKSIEQILDRLGDAVEPVEPPAAIKSDLMARVHAMPRVTVAPRRVDSSGLRRVAAYAGAALCASLAGLLAGYLLPQYESPGLAPAAYARQLAVDQKAFTSVDTHFAALGTADASHRGVGYVIWDPIARQVHFVAFDVGTPAPGEVTCLWLSHDDKTWNFAAELAETAKHASAVFDVPKSVPNVTRLAVTTEKSWDGDAAPTAPRGPIAFEARF